jgi:hypothetical protein
MNMVNPNSDPASGKIYAIKYKKYDDDTKTMISGYLPLDPRSYNSFSATRGGEYTYCTADEITSTSGTIKDSDNNPVSGATVTLKSLTSASTEGDVLQTKTTGDDGTYQFDNVNAGYLYCVNVTKDGYNQTDEHPYIIDNCVNDYVLSKTEVYLKGVVKDYQGQPVSGVDILAKDSAGKTIKQATLDNEGGFDLQNLPLGEVTLTLDSSDYYFKKTVNLTKSSDQSLSPYIANKKISFNIEIQNDGKIINDDTQETVDSIDYYIGATQLKRDDAYPDYITVQNPEETIKLKAVPKEGATFEKFEIDNVTDYKITAYFSKCTLHLYGKVLNTLNEPIVGATVTFTTTEPKEYTATTNEEGYYELTDISRNVSGSFVIDSDSGYVLDKSVENLNESSENFYLAAYKIYELNLSVNNTEFGKIQHDGKDADEQVPIYQSLTDVKIDGADLILTYKGEEFKYTAVAKGNANFDGWTIEPENTNTDLNDTVTGNLKAVATFSKLHIAGKLLNTSNEPVKGAEVTFTTTDSKVFKSITNENGEFILDGIAKGSSGIITINHESGYVFEKSIDNLQSSFDDFNLEANKIYSLNLSVNNKELGQILINGEQAEEQYTIYENESNVTVDGSNLIVKNKDEELTFTATAKDGANFEG